MEQAMVEHVGHIRNPLTIVAIFAALAEVSGTVILPLIPLETQQIYVYFLMGFPVILLLLFFSVLLFKHHVLYAPSDFNNDDTFKDILQHRSYNEVINKIDTEIELTSGADTNSLPSEKVQSSSSVDNDSFVVSYRGYNIFVEDLVIEKLTRDMRIRFDRYLALKTNSKVVFDAVSYGEDNAVVLDVYFTRVSVSVNDKIDNFIERVNQFIDEIPSSLKGKVLFVFSIVTDREDRLDKILKRVERFGMVKFIGQYKLELRVFLLKNKKLEEINTSKKSAQKEDV
ncbi:hypothetical protein [Desulfolutivibrio sulfoxidireducens]|uniref:hypothetical protein n=1 Tax=Desulfolutivibrio sulfoxidireducens TaxID=2773299 RepID=UPI00159E676F|nr:hypothetical protein [Desulfolutivibrio sulfoxidireducens]QLA15973.1 hypothetical protein GD605_07355 [Desulfolutivibrio sulfoxidireducens]